MNAPSFRAVFVVLTMWLLLAASSPPIEAAWPPDGLPLATGPNRQFNPIGLTGASHQLHAFWVDVESPTHALFTQHVTIEGTLAPGWPEGGRGLVERPAFIGTPIAIADGADGAVLAWYDHRAGARGVYAIRVDSTGAVVPGFPPSGAVVCTATVEGRGALDQLMAIASDGAGGAFVAWTDSRNTPTGGVLIYDVFAQHIRGDGTLDPAWPAPGLALTSGSGYKYPQALVADDDGGFWLLTESASEWTPGTFYAIHHDASGTALGQWSPPGFAARPVATEDLSGGIFVAWDDCRDCPTFGDVIYLNRLDPGAEAHFGWPEGGIPLRESGSDEGFPTIVRTSDGGVMVSWLEEIVGAPNRHAARKILPGADPVPGWHGAFTTFVESLSASGWPKAVTDGAGGAMYAYRLNEPNLFGSRVDLNGNVPAVFPDTGLALCSVTGDQYLEDLVSDGANGAFVLWEDRRDPTSDVDVYAMRFTREGEVGSITSVDPPSIPPGNVVALAPPRPNPSTGDATFAVRLTTAARLRVEILDLRGRIVAVPWSGPRGPGSHAVSWNGRDRDGHAVPPGIYLVRAAAAGRSATRRIVRL
jgi:hypothetical protein